MASESRFENVESADLLQLLENKDSKSTKSVIKGSVKILEAFCTEKRIPNLSQLCNAELDETLQLFYAGARTKTKDFYSKKSLVSIRYGLQKHFEKERKIDIVNGDEFKSSNKIFSAMLVKLKKEGKGSVTHKNPLTKEDLVKLYSSFDVGTPKGLQDKVFVDFMLYFCNRGRENLRELKKSDFILHENQQFIELKDRLTKNHQGGLHDGASQGGRIYKTTLGEGVCPFTSFMKYLAKLNPQCESFFQRPKAARSLDNPDIWYDNMVIGIHTLGNKMKILKKKCLSREYTNHCLRATSITLLDCFEARHVMTVSGHTSAASITNYARTWDDKRREMADTITEATVPTATLSKCPDSDEETELHVHVTVPAQQPESVPESASLSNENESTQLLELTASQEVVLKEDIGALLNTPVNQNLHAPHSAPWNPQFNYDMFQDQSNKPIFYFQNSTVNFFGSGGPH